MALLYGCRCSRYRRLPLIPNRNATGIDENVRVIEKNLVDWRHVFNATLTPMIKNTFSILFGILVAIGVIFIFEALGHVIYPTPANLKLENPGQLQNIIAHLPVGNLLFVLLAWVLGAFTGAFGAMFFAKSRHPALPGIVTAFVFVAAVSNFFFVPYPRWFEICAIVTVPLSGWVAWKIYKNGATP